MKTRPTIFLSGVSPEFGSFRDAVENEIEMKGCFAENQPGFPPDHRSVEEMLTRKLADADAVIHIVGFRFGAEQKNRKADTPRRSYTQMEFDIANKLSKPVYRFLSKADTVRDDPKADEQTEDDETKQLQLAHREAVTKSNSLYYYFKDKAELCKLVAEIPPVATAGFHVDISRIDRYAPAHLIGREPELALLENAWQKVRFVESPRPHVITFVALGGEGKTSLVAKWAALLANANWPGCDAAFAWSFYSQGTKEQSVASSDLFLKEALVFFGDSEMANSARMAVDKAKRLAELVGEKRALLILDGLEPLQYPPTSPLKGELKDQGISALLKKLAAKNNGLCVVTTRYSVADLKNYWQSTAPEVALRRLSKEAGVSLLKTLGVKGTQKEFEKLVEDVKGHALTLNLLGTYLHDAHAGDIRKRDLVKLEDADLEEQGGHAFHIMDAYVKWFESEGAKGKQAVSILRLLGLFDRPASADCIEALKQAPVIPNLTEALVGMTDAQRNIAFTRLVEAKLLTVNRDEAGSLVSLDAHPLLREYFANRLRTQRPEACRAAHQRLYEHLRDTTKEGNEPTLEDLQPLYQAVVHGCQAGLQREARAEVYNARIARGGEAFAVKKLGAFGSDLGAVACFFEIPWSQVSRALVELERAAMLNHAAFRLRAMGRLTESLEPMRIGLEILTKQSNWANAAVVANNLSELELTLGEVERAVVEAEQSVIYADRSGDAFKRVSKRTTHADALHQAGHRAEAEPRFSEAEQMQTEHQPDYPLLYSARGFKYCDILLAAPEHAAWQRCLTNKAQPLTLHHSESCQAVFQRAAQTITWVTKEDWLLDIALDHLTLGRAALYTAILAKPEFRISTLELEQAVDGLRRAGTQHHIPRGFLTRAWLRALTNKHTGPDSAQADLDEAWEIAERGPMRLHMADIHLYRARLFHSIKPYPWNRDEHDNPRGPKDDLAAARKLIEQCGYWRRKEELEDAEEAAKNWPGAEK
ncbi:MAG: DUF4062 domain-containing protein [Planctomycetota bacterium]